MASNSRTRRPAATHADGDLEQARANALQHMRMLGEQGGHARFVRLAVPMFRGGAQRGPHEGRLGVAERQRFLVAQKPVVLKVE